MRGMGNMQGMMKQVQKMQKQMGEAQEALNAKEFVGVASGDTVKMTMTGDKKVINVEIAKEAVDPDDIEMLQDLILMATNDVLAKIEVETEATMGKYTKGLPGF